METGFAGVNLKACCSTFEPVTRILIPLDGPSQHLLRKNGLPAQAAGFMDIDLQSSTGVLLGFLLLKLEVCDHDVLGRLSKRMAERQDVIGFGRARRRDYPGHRNPGHCGHTRRFQQSSP